MRERALCEDHCKLFEVKTDPSSRSFFSEILASVSDADFTSDGRYLVARDFMNVNVWDIAMERVRFVEASGVMFVYPFYSFKCINVCK